MPPDQKLVVDASASPWRRADSLTPKYDNSACSHNHRGENDLHQKRWFFGKNGSSSTKRCSTHWANRKRIDSHAASILALIELCTASNRGLYSKFFSKKYVKCSSFENGELMLMVVQAHSEQQQQCFRLTLMDEHVNELLYPIRIQLPNSLHKLIYKLRWRHFFSIKFST